MESIKGGDIKKPQLSIASANLVSVGAIKAETIKAKPAAAADSVGRSSKAPEFAPQAEKMGVEESQAFGQSIKMLAAEEGAPKLAPATVTVWTNENNFTSGGKLKQVTIPEVAITSQGIRTPHALVSGLQPIDKLDGQQPFDGNSKVTRDAFDQVQLTACIQSHMDLQAAVGIDNDKIWKAKTNDGICRAKANAIPDLNAFYSPTSNDLNFGTNNGKWHLASDNDVTGHEKGHNLGDKENPNMFSGEGGAIHEGYFGDFPCALVARNANLSEDFGTALGTPGQPLRNLANDKTLREAGSEVHDRGEAYGGFGWRITEKLATKVGGLDKACDIMLHVALKTGFYFTSKSPTSKDFVDAVIKCAKDSLPKVIDQGTVDFVCDAIKAEGVKRGMISKSWTAPGAPTDAKTIAFNAALGGEAATCSSDVAKGALGKVFGTRKDCEITTYSELAWKNPASGLQSQKLIMQLRAVDPQSGKKYPVEDGYMAMVATGANVSDLAGNGRRILEQGSAYKFDFAPLPNKDALVKEARAAIEKFIETQLESGHKHLQTTLMANKSRFFNEQDMLVEEVMNKGKICLSITSPAGQFIYDHRDHSIEAHRLMFVDNFAEKKAK